MSTKRAATAFFGKKRLGMLVSAAALPMGMATTYYVNRQQLNRPTGPKQKVEVAELHQEGAVAFETMSSRDALSAIASLVQQFVAFLQQRTAQHKQDHQFFQVAHAAAAKFAAGERKAGLPEYTLDEIATHNKRPSKKNAKSTVWVVYKAGVYDITEFIDSHPGGAKRIMLAAGSTIEPFWRQFTIHANEEVHKQLEAMRIGNLKGYDASKTVKDDVDPEAMWANEPRRHPALDTRTQRPFNAETPADAMTDTGVISNELFFVRNHLPVPVIDEKTFCLEVGGEGLFNDCISIPKLKSTLQQKSVTTTIQCGGNRRSDSAARHPNEKVKGLTWSGGAIGTAEWSGISLRELLYSMTADESILNKLADQGYHVKFEGADKDASSSFEVSIPLTMALDESREAIVAWSMNKEPIPRDHGFPLRAVIPGTVGVRNAKWLKKITVAPDESQSDWQQRDYKYFPSWLSQPDSSLPSIYDTPVQSVITEASRDGDTVSVKGYAYIGGGRGIQRVEVSEATPIEAGKQQAGAAPKVNFARVAELSDGGIKQAPGRRWAWNMFSSEFRVPSKLQDAANNNDDPMFDVCVRAISQTNDIQPEVAPYNFRGLLYNGYSCVQV